MTRARFKTFKTLKEVFFIVVNGVVNYKKASLRIYLRVFKCFKFISCWHYDINHILEAKENVGLSDLVSNSNKNIKKTIKTI